MSGFLWRSLPELKQRTAQLMSNPGLRLEMGRAARAASFRHSRTEFKRRMAEALRPLFEDARREGRP